MITLEKIKDLFEKGEITADEKWDLIEKCYGNKNPVSQYLKLTFFISILTWILMLKFTYDNKEYALLPSGNARYWAGIIGSGLSLILLFLARREEQLLYASSNEKMRYFSLGIICAVLSIVFPVLLVQLFL